MSTSPLTWLINLVQSAIRAAQPVPMLKYGIDLLNKLKEQLDNPNLVVGVVGVTSSGKSTFINAVLGEQLLPEQSRATTNLTVSCYRGPRLLKVLYKNKRIEEFTGDRLNKKLLMELCSEDGNPQNERGIERLELYLPEALVPKNLALVDTPGIDSYGKEYHETVTLEEFLPLADILIFMASIKNPLKNSSLKLIERIIDNDQRTLFALTMIDTERDDCEGGKLS